MQTSAKLLVAATIGLTAGWLAHAQTPPAGPQRAPFDVRKTGTVTVQRDHEGNPAGVVLVVTSYHITMDEQGARLADLDGYKVRVTGAFSFDEDNRRWITANNIETIAAPQPAEKPAAAEPAAEEPQPDAGQPAEPAAETPAE